MRSLKILGVDFTQYGTHLLPISLAKLPEELCLTSKKGITKDDWSLETVLEVFKSELEAREQCGWLEATKASTANGSGKQNRTTPFTATALLMNKNASTCSFCTNIHQSAKCNICTEPQARLAIIKGQGRCFICLKKGHLSQNCTSKVKCYFCKQRYHASLCEGNSSRVDPNQVPPGEFLILYSGSSIPGNYIMLLTLIPNSCNTMQANLHQMKLVLLNRLRHCIHQTTQLQLCLLAPVIQYCYKQPVATFHRQVM